MKIFTFPPPKKEQKFTLYFEPCWHSIAGRGKRLFPIPAMFPSCAKRSWRIAILKKKKTRWISLIDLGLWLIHSFSGKNHHRSCPRVQGRSKGVAEFQKENSQKAARFRKQQSGWKENNRTIRRHIGWQRSRRVQLWQCGCPRGVCCKQSNARDRTCQHTQGQGIVKDNRKKRLDEA